MYSLHFQHFKKSSNTCAYGNNMEIQKHKEIVTYIFTNVI